MQVAAQLAAAVASSRSRIIPVTVYFAPSAPFFFESFTTDNLAAGTCLISFFSYTIRCSSFAVCLASPSVSEVAVVEIVFSVGTEVFSLLLGFDAEARFAAG